MKAFTYFILAIIAGLATSFVLIVAVELFSNVVHPFPAEFQGTHDEICRHVENYPAWILASVVPMWGATAYVGSRVAWRISGGMASSTVAVLLFAGLAFNISMLPYPIWFEIACLVAIPVASLVAMNRKLPQMAGR